MSEALVASQNKAMDAAQKLLLEAGLDNVVILASSFQGGDTTQTYSRLAGNCMANLGQLRSEYLAVEKHHTNNRLKDAT